MKTSVGIFFKVKSKGARVLHPLTYTTVKFKKLKIVPRIGERVFVSNVDILNLSELIRPTSNIFVVVDIIWGEIDCAFDCNVIVEEPN